MAISFRRDVDAVLAEPKSAQRQVLLDFSVGDTAAAFGKQYQQSSWAKKASVWGK